MLLDWRNIVLLLAATMLLGCSTPLRGGKSPLLPAQMSSDSVVLDIFFARYPFGDKKINETLWEQIDEQQFSPEVRQRLAGSGFRVGIVSGQIPTELSKLLQLSDKPAVKEKDEPSITPVSEMEADPRVTQRHLQLRANHRSEIIASGIYEQVPVLLNEAGQLSGQTYHQAQGIFAIKSSPRADGCVRLELLPELHYDQPRQRWVGGQGMMRLETSRPKRVFEDMTLVTNLSPGAMIVMGSLPNRPGSLGHYFFSESESAKEQKLLVIRLSQTQRDGLFSTPETLKLDDASDGR